jgi:hypothetical protein
MPNISVMAVLTGGTRFLSALRLNLACDCRRGKTANTRPGRRPKVKPDQALPLGGNIDGNRFQFKRHERVSYNATGMARATIAFKSRSGESIPKVLCQSAPKREAQKASPTAFGAWRTRSEACNPSANRSAISRAIGSRSTRFVVMALMRLTFRSIAG